MNAPSGPDPLWTRANGLKSLGVVAVRVPPRASSWGVSAEHRQPPERRAAVLRCERGGCWIAPWTGGGNKSRLFFRRNPPVPSWFGEAVPSPSPREAGGCAGGAAVRSHLASALTGFGWFRIQSRLSSVRPFEMFPNVALKCFLMATSCRRRWEPTEPPLRCASPAVAGICLPSGIFSGARSLAFRLLSSSGRAPRCSSLPSSLRGSLVRVRGGFRKPGDPCCSPRGGGCVPGVALSRSGGSPVSPGCSLRCWGWGCARGSRGSAPVSPAGSPGAVETPCQQHLFVHQSPGAC